MSKRYVSIELGENLSIDKLPAVSALSNANINRNSGVFESIYQQLLHYYKEELSCPVESSFLARQVVKDYQNI